MDPLMNLDSSEGLLMKVAELTHVSGGSKDEVKNFKSKKKQCTPICEIYK